jgi:ribosome-associated protein
MSDPTLLPQPTPDGDRLVVNARVAIPRSELSYRATRAGGPGGQHVNTSSTRIELLWNPSTSAAVDDASRGLILERLAGRLDAEGNVRVVASESRSQRQNRERADVRLAELVRGALVVKKKRRPTRPSRAAKEARLEDKRRRSTKKRDRRRGIDE